MNRLSPSIFIICVSVRPEHRIFPEHCIPLGCRKQELIQFAAGCATATMALTQCATPASPASGSRIFRHAWMNPSAATRCGKRPGRWSPERTGQWLIGVRDTRLRTQWDSAHVGRISLAQGRCASRRRVPAVLGAFSGPACALCHRLSRRAIRARA